jgi:hypothetical protein
MLRTLAIAAAFALAAGAASAQKIDAKGHCHDAKGKMAPMSVCKPAANAAAAAPKQCKTGKPCGNTCIAKDKVCHK